MLRNKGSYLVLFFHPFHPFLKKHTNVHNTTNMPTWCFCFGHVYLRIIQSYNNLGLKRLIISLSAIISLTLASPPLYHVPKCHNYTSFKYLQGWNSTTSLGSLFLIVLESIIFMLKIKLQFILIRKTKFPHLCELIFLVKLRPWYKLFNSFLVVQNIKPVIVILQTMLLILWTYRIKENKNVCITGLVWRNLVICWPIKGHS